MQKDIDGHEKKNLIGKRPLVFLRNANSKLSQELEI